MTPKMTPQQLEISRTYFETESRIVGYMQRAGVGVLAGTDTPNPYVYPGFALHDELELLVSAGLTPMEALETATRNPARFLGMSDSIGTIEKGKAADLVLLDSDPLIDIRNTRKIDAVFVPEKMFDRPALDEILAQVKRNRWQVNAAALILAEPVIHMLHKLLYIIPAALRAHHRNLDALIAKSGNPSCPFSFDRGPPFRLKAELSKEINCSSEVIDDDSYVIHSFERRASNLRSVA